jgi:PHD/YefM family antitoxin component YafN of YafNO toxin-antitoxin module
VVRELQEIRERIDSLIETLEVSSDKEFLAEIKESLKEAERGEGRSIGELIEALERLTGK